MGMILAPHLIGALGEYGINNAALFDGATGCLTKTWATAETSNKIKTTSFWLFKNDPVVSGTQRVYTASPGASGGGSLMFLSGDILAAENHGTTYSLLKTSSVYRDVIAYHIVDVIDSTQATPAERRKTYINNVQVTFTSGSDMALNQINHWLESGFANEICRYNAGTAQYLDGALAEFYAIDGQALTPSDFGEEDADTGNWVAKKYTGTYGNNGFYLDFSNGADLGEDQSGNGNDWTEVGTLTQVTSTPMNVLCAWTPLHPAGDGSATDAQPTYSNGNNTLTAASTWYGTFGTLKCPEKFYFRVQAVTNAATGRLSVGVVSAALISAYPSLTSNLGNAAAPGAWMIAERHEMLDIRLGNEGFLALSATNYSDGDWVDVWGDLSGGDGAGKIWFGKNGTPWAGDPEAGTGASFTNVAADVFPACDGFTNTIATADFATSSGTFGNICTNNLPAMVATDKNVNNHFKTVLYTGDGVAIGSGGNAVTGVGFQPDFVWGKSRSGANSHNVFDAVRGVENRLMTDLTNAEQTGATEYLSTFDADGFTVGNAPAMNTSGHNYVAWCASLPNTKTSGWSGSPSITPTKEIYNTDLGMSIVTYTGDGSDGSIPHSLGVAPKMVIIKNLDTAGQPWMVYHKDIGNGYYLNLDSTAAKVASADMWSSADPTNELVFIGTSSQVNQNTKNLVAYIFAETDFCKIGSWTGNNSTDGPYIAENFSPVFWLNKASTQNYSWMIMDAARDPYNSGTTANTLFPNVSAVENDASNNPGKHDWTATGVKIRESTAVAWYNGPAQPHAYLMIGQPTGTRNANEATAR